MNKLLRILKNPMLIFGFLLIAYSMKHTLKGDGLSHVVRSDGRGYYAYLPAFFIYHDGSFEKSARVEKSYFPDGTDQLYLFKDADGKQYNKYFPGIAILQLPFFAVACLVSWLTGHPVDGYSGIFLFCYYIGSLFYTTCGLILFSKCLKKLFPDKKKLLNWLVPAFYLTSPLLFYSIFTPSFSHLYSFFLFGVFTWIIFGLKEDFRTRNVFLLGLVIGLIALLRPTNLVIVLLIPFLLGGAEQTAGFFRKLFQDRLKNLLLGLLAFFIVLSVIFLSWKWQTGKWTVWSYSGEGFNFLRPQLFATLFSFRTGLFLHAPVMLLSLAGVILVFRKNKFQALFWSIYFIVNCWIISSWWCWDYESPFGNRPLTEHFFFLFIPLVFFAGRYRFLAAIGLSGLAIIGTIRLWEIKTGFMGDQRFTRNNYVSSLLFWKKENDNRWNFTRSCPPFGEKINEMLLLNLAESKNVKSEEEFAFTVEKQLPKPRSNERYYFRVELEKQVTDPRIDDVMLVIDAYNADNSKRFYRATGLFNDRFEGYGKWAPLIFEGHIYDYLQEYDFVKIYIWNQGRKNFYIRKIKITLEEYKAKV